MMAHQDGSCAGSLQPDLCDTCWPDGVSVYEQHAEHDERMPSMMTSMPSMAGMGMGAMMGPIGSMCQPTCSLGDVVQKIESLPEVEQKLQAYQMAMTALYQMPMLMAQVGRPHYQKDKLNEWLEMPWSIGDCRCL
jgi:hypothetical protein